MISASDLRGTKMAERQKSGEQVAEEKLSKTSISDFVGDVKAEIGKITWTSREEMQTYVKVVVGATFFFGMGIYFVDLIIQGILNGLSVLTRLIGG